MRPRTLAIVTTHPIQYQAPWFRGLAQHTNLELDVFFCHRPTSGEQAQAGYDVAFEWDVPLLEGYSHRFLKNVARKPGISNYFGLDTPEIKTILREGGYDAVLLCGWNYKSAWQAIFTCWRERIPVMVRGDSHLYTRRSWFTRLAKSIVYPRFISRFDACLAVGRWSKEYYLYYNAAPERIFLAPHTVDNDFFDRQATSLEHACGELRAGWGIPEDSVVFLFIGRFIPKKRPMDFVQAIERASNRGASIAGLMVGDGVMRADCEKYVSEKGIPVRFAGFLNQSEIPKAYVACDALVLPSDNAETWGLVANEAMASGKACIVSDQAGCSPDLIVFEETGFTYSCGDVESLSVLMERLAGDPALLRKMGESARGMLNDHASISQAVNGIVMALCSVSA